MHIRKAALELILGASRNLYPNEFIGLLRGKGDTIDEVLVLPGTLFGEGFAQVQLHMLPIDHSVIGSVHSHPGAVNRPSRQDLVLFGKTGRFHLIVRQPALSLGDVACYGRDGDRLELKAK